MTETEPPTSTSRPEATEECTVTPSMTGEAHAALDERIVTEAAHNEYAAGAMRVSNG